MIARLPRYDKAAREEPWTQRLWIYDFRTNTHFTLKANTLRRAELDEFVAAYNPQNRHDRKPTERFRCFTYDELMQRDKVSLDIFWLKDDSLEDTDRLPPPKEIAADIVENLEAALEQFQAIEGELGAEATPGRLTL